MIQNHVTSLSQRLQKLGVKQESEFYWYKDEIDINDFEWRLGVLDYDLDGNPQLHGFGYNLDIVHGKKSFNPFEYISAFLSSEVGELLPDAVAVYRYKTEDEGDLNVWACIKYVEGDHDKYEHVNHAPTEAEARGLMLEYLLLNGLITL